MFLGFAASGGRQRQCFGGQIMSKDHFDESSNLTANIQFLVSTEPSISFAARRLGINRQQLNKYLNGTSVPSLRILRRFAVAFDLPTEALMGPPELLKQQRTHAEWETRRRPEHLIADQLTAISENAKDDLARYCGRYFRYNIIPTSPVLVLRTYMVIYQQDAMTFAHILERLTKSGAPWRRSETHRSTHIVTQIQDRIQFIDFGDPGKDSVPSFSILYPEYTSGIHYLSGMQLSSFAYGKRPIYKSNLVFQRLPGAGHSRRDLNACGVFDLDDPTLHEDIRYRLSRESGAPSVRVADR